MKAILKKVGTFILYLIGYVLLMEVFFKLDIIEDFVKVIYTTLGLGVLFLIGFLIVFLSPHQDAARKRFAQMAPWVPLGIFFLIVFVLSPVAWLGLTMILPVLMVASSSGGLFARCLTIRRKRRGK